MSEIPMEYGEEKYPEVTRQGDFYHALTELNDILAQMRGQIDRLAASCIQLGGPLDVAENLQQETPQVKPVPSRYTQLRETIQEAGNLYRKAEILAAAFEERI